MSSTSSVCQVTKTALDEPRVLRLKLAPPGKPNNADVAGLSFLQCLGNDQTALAGPEKPDPPYVHPLARRSASRLSDASLAMCTESLGSESSGDDAPIASPENDVTFRRPSRGVTSLPGEFPAVLPESDVTFRQSHIISPESDVTFRRRRRSSGGSAAGGFPPPLSSVGVRVRQRREEGRLILTAESVSGSGSGLVADRSDGRLRIRMLIEREEIGEAKTEGFGGEGQNGKECENVGVGGESGNKGFLRGRRSRRCQGARAWEQDLGEPFWVAT